MIPNSLNGIGNVPVFERYTNGLRYDGNPETSVGVRDAKSVGIPTDTEDTRKTGDANDTDEAKSIEDVHRHSGRRSSPEECQTCKNRKYQDGSDEMVSFKNASHISPNEAAVRVRAHEQEHVSNAYAKATQNDGKVVSANVSIHTSICPECGRTYVSGGLTTTQIKYPNEENPYQKARKTQEHTTFSGAHMDLGT